MLCCVKINYTLIQMQFEEFFNLLKSKLLKNQTCILTYDHFFYTIFKMLTFNKKSILKIKKRPWEGIACIYTLVIYKQIILLNYFHFPTSPQ